MIWILGSLLYGIWFKLNLISFLMTLEMSLLLVFYMIFCSLNVDSLMVFIVAMVSSSVLGLILIMKMVSLHGDEKMKSLNLSKL